MAERLDVVRACACLYGEAIGANRPCEAKVRGLPDRPARCMQPAGRHPGRRRLKSAREKKLAGEREDPMSKQGARREDVPRKIRGVRLREGRKMSESNKSNG